MVTLSFIQWKFFATIAFFISSLSLQDTTSFFKDLRSHISGNQFCAKKSLHKAGWNDRPLTKNITKWTFFHCTCQPLPTSFFFLFYCPLIITLWGPYPIRMPLSVLAYDNQHLCSAVGYAVSWYCVCCSIGCSVGFFVVLCGRLYMT